MKRPSPVVLLKPQLLSLTLKPVYPSVCGCLCVLCIQLRLKDRHYSRIRWLDAARLQIRRNLLVSSLDRSIHKSVMKLRGGCRSCLLLCRA